MDSQIVAVLCLCDDMLKALHHYEDPQCQMTDAEVMTTAIIAALHFRGNFELSRHFLDDEGMRIGYLQWPSARTGRGWSRAAGMAARGCGCGGRGT